MALTKAKLQNFTAFADLEVEFSPGINVLVGENGTGKTHLLKVCYAACDVARTGDAFSEKLVRVFLPSRRSIGALVKRNSETDVATVAISRGKRTLQAKFSRHHSIHQRLEDYSGGPTGVQSDNWADSSLVCAYIPVKDMLANAPGFRSLYAEREIHFEEIYHDILQRAYLPPLRKLASEPLRKQLDGLKAATGGSVVINGEEFFLHTEDGFLEFTLLAEGMRKLALLQLLLRNGTLRPGAALFWDEPETNLNPALLKLTMEVLLELQRAGVQIFLATHDYVVLRELDLQAESADEVVFHSLFHDENGEISWAAAKNYLAISPNAIEDTNTDLYDRQIQRNLGYLTQ